MLPKPTIMQIAEQVNGNGETAVSDRMMEFTLAPSTNQTSKSMSMTDMQAQNTCIYKTQSVMTRYMWREQTKEWA